MNDVIEREITIEAPIATVWEVITKPAYIVKWFSDSAELELKPGGKGKIGWDRSGEAPLEIIDVDEPHTFSFRWVAADEATRRINGKTLVTFTLFAEGDGTKVHLTESGFENLALTDEEKISQYDKHVSGWAVILPNLQKYLDSNRRQN